MEQSPANAMPNVQVKAAPAPMPMPKPIKTYPSTLGSYAAPNPQPIAAPVHHAPVYGCQSPAFAHGCSYPVSAKEACGPKTTTNVLLVLFILLVIICSIWRIVR